MSGTCWGEKSDEECARMKNDLFSFLKSVKKQPQSVARLACETLVALLLVARGNCLG